MKLDPLKRAPTLGERAATSLLELILREGLEPGHELPSIAELAQRLGVSRNTIREAIQRLAALGAVCVSSGRKMIVGDAVPGLALADSAWANQIRESALDELLEIRSLLEPGAASLAAERATDGELDELERVALEIGQATSPRDAWDAQWRFHLKLVALSGNKALSRFFDSCMITLSSPLFEGLKRFYDPPPLDEAEIHLAIVGAARARDAERTRILVLEHVGNTVSNVSWVRSLLPRGEGASDASG